MTFKHGDMIVHHQPAMTRPGFIGDPKTAIYVAPDVPRPGSTAVDWHIIRIKRSNRQGWNLACVRSSSIKAA